jgi:hypothetical protein
MAGCFVGFGLTAVVAGSPAAMRAVASNHLLRLKHMAGDLPEGRRGAYAIVGALSLHLNFINLFLMLLRFTGGRRDSLRD